MTNPALKMGSKRFASEYGTDNEVERVAVKALSENSINAQRHHSQRVKNNS